MKLKHAKKNAGFTLVELLVVIAIIAVLAGLSTPIVLRKIAESNATTAQNNAKDIYKGLVAYALANGTFPPTAADSNTAMLPLFAASFLIDEAPFYVAGTTGTYPTNVAPDGDVSTGLDTETNTNVFSYVTNADTTAGWSHGAAPGNAPLLLCPVPDANVAGPEVVVFGDDFSSFGVILDIGGGSKRHSLSPAGLAVTPAGAAIPGLFNTDGSGTAVVMAGIDPA